MEIIKQTIKSIQGWLNNKLEHPSLSKNINRSSIGKSINNKGIFCYEIGSGSISILLVGGIHGNETGSVKFLSKLANWLHSNRDNYPHFKFLIIPCLNPDGYEQAKQFPDYWRGGLLGRFNSHGVDLNRNFPTPSFQSKSLWGRGKNYTKTIEVYCGPSGGSEPEIQSLISLITDRKPNLFISFHNIAGDILGNKNEFAQKLAETFSNASGYKEEHLEDWQKLQQTGTAKEWCDMQNIPYLECEGRYRWSSDWKPQLKGIKAILETLTKD